MILRSDLQKQSYNLEKAGREDVNWIELAQKKGIELNGVLV
jgi:hypothetical protein